MTLIRIKAGINEGRVVLGTHCSSKAIGLYEMCGPDGVLFPMINSPEEAEKAVKSCLYPPCGTRGFDPYTRHKL